MKEDAPSRSDDLLRTGGDQVAREPTVLRTLRVPPLDTIPPDQENR
ncbi:hypothetical protein [Streptacidiphilus sp. PAMC 29251]